MLKRAFALLLLAGVATGPAIAGDQPDLAVVHRIKQEAFERSQVMDHLFYMTDVHGPRLTGSPGHQAAAEWAASRAREIGLANVALESWGPFGRGWSTSYFAAHLVAPRYAPLIGVPIAWAPGTAGVVTGTPILTPLRLGGRGGSFEDDEREVERFIEEHRGKLAGQIVLMAELKHLELATEAAAERLDEADLGKRAKADELLEPIAIDWANPQVPKDPQERRRFFASAPDWLRRKIFQRRRGLTNKVAQFLVEEGVRLAVYPSADGDGGTIFPPRVASYEADAPLPPPSIALTPEHYNRIVRLLQHDIPVTIEVEVRAEIHPSPESVNVVAELPGGKKKDQLVIIGAHFDDVVYATGATDNAAGSAVMMEVMRILSTLELPLARTVRMVLWSGEEEGLLGSKAYVKKHFGDPETMALEPEHGRVSGYFNFDNGGGKIRGVYLQGNDMVQPIFSSWLSPFRDLGATTTTLRDTGGTDHLSFDAVGIPGFQFLQDPLEYNSRTHHSNMDVYDRVPAGDLMQAAAVIATFVYETANREEMLPRKPLPEPWPEEARTKEETTGGG